MAAPEGKPAVEFFGIRHHGPGSARRLAEALEALRPSVVLIEGPADASELIPLLADPRMVPPVALLTYPSDDPEETAFWPFARFSPEYQAILWAVRNGVEARFIDLPAGRRPKRRDPLAELIDEDAGDALNGEASEDEGRDGEAPDDGASAPGDLAATAANSPAEGREERPAGTEETEDASTVPNLHDVIRRDPVGALARAAGYEDGESWWRDVIEENPEPGPVFTAIADAMTALREGEPALEMEEAAREAHMRLEIAKARKDASGPVAVVCGAYHVPALTAKVAQKDDRAALKELPKRKIAATWAPWTSPRLAFASGYGAGVTAPGWCAHLWDAPDGQIASRWVAKIARTLREDGHVVSTASLIEAERLALSLAALRGRPAPGFEELRDAAISCLCFGEALLWETVATRLLIGAEVGEIPPDVPLAPLLEDLQRQQKSARLKPEALDRELSLDLRSDSGLFRSTLLHRLTILGAPWGQLTDAGRSRGTFRERWVLRWEPEYAVGLVEKLVYGATIEQAAGGVMRERLGQAETLGDLADLVLSAMTAQLPGAAAAGIDLLGERAGRTSDCGELLTALPPLADVVRYGEARATDTAGMRDLLRRIAVQGALSLHYAARGLDAEAAAGMRAAVLAADGAIRLVELGEEELTVWTDALRAVLGDEQAARLVSGTAARLLYEAEAIGPEETAATLSRMLSPGTEVKQAAAFFEGFFDGAGQRLIHDKPLRDAVDGWVITLEEETFTEYLPLFRRVFAGLDRSERRHLLDAVLGRAAQAMPGLIPAPDGGAAWARHFTRIADILTREPADG